MYNTLEVTLSRCLLSSTSALHPNWFGYRNHKFEELVGKSENLLLYKLRSDLFHIFFFSFRNRTWAPGPSSSLVKFIIQETTEPLTKYKLKQCFMLQIPFRMYTILGSSVYPPHRVGDILSLKFGPPVFLPCQACLTCILCIFMRAQALTANSARVT